MSANWRGREILQSLRMNKQMLRAWNCNFAPLKKIMTDVPTDRPPHGRTDTKWRADRLIGEVKLPKKHYCVTNSCMHYFPGCYLLSLHICTMDMKKALLAIRYRVFIKYCVFSLKFCNFSELCQFCCSAGVLPSCCVYTHWHRGKTEKYKSPEYSKSFGKKTIFNEHPVP